MKEQKKELTEEQVADAERLLELWKKRPSPKISQEKAGEDWGIGTQGVVWQYLHGKIPLNLPVVLKFAAGLKRHPAEISPTLAEPLPKVTMSPLGELGKDPNFLQLIGLYVQLDEVNVAKLMTMVNNAFVEQHPKKSHANPFTGLKPPQVAAKTERPNHE